MGSQDNFRGASVSDRLGVRQALFYERFIDLAYDRFVDRKISWDVYASFVLNARARWDIGSHDVEDYDPPQIPRGQRKYLNHS
jgi:hypothetical protein